MTKPGQMVMLENRHNSEVVEDVTDRIWALFGTAVHGVLQMGEMSSHLAEQYFKETVSGVELSGISDLYEDAVMWDYKVTSAWSWVFRADRIKDFESQLNIYAWFFQKTGLPVKALKICMILRDWQRSNTLRDPEYPQNQVQVIPINLWPFDETQKYIENRISYYEALKTVPDESLPECSEADRWAKAPRYAVMKKGVKKAQRVLETKEEAEKWAKEKGGPLYLEERKGDLWKRCEYCRVQPFCHQYRKGHES